MIAVGYDAAFDPPAPVMPLRIYLPDSDGWLQLVGLADTGADITLVPREVAQRELPLAGTVALLGVTGETEEAILYRAQLQVGGMSRVMVVAGFGSQAIVGRDLLNQLILNLDGPARQLTVDLS